MTGVQTCALPIFPADGMPENLPQVVVDRVLLQQVILNSSVVENVDSKIVAFIPPNSCAINKFSRV